MTEERHTALFLIGPRASGKSTVGRLVAGRLEVPFYDTDDMVMAEAGRSIADIVRLEGWESFRERESRALVLALNSHAGTGRPSAVVSTGGGMVLAWENRERMRAAGVVFYLAAPPDCLHARLERHEDAGRRPSLTGESPLAEMVRVLEERDPLYRATAHHVIDATASRVVMEQNIIGLLAAAREESS